MLILELFFFLVDNTKKTVHKERKKKIRNYSLSSYNYLIEEAVNLDYANGNDLEMLKKWRGNPKEWNN